MNHPFDLDIADLEAIDLDFEETLSDEEAARIGGGIMATTLAIGEEGGGIQCISAPCPGSEGGGGFPPQPIPIHPPVTTLAIGEEGGGSYTKAWFEGGGGPLDW
ncbi:MULTISPECIES: hypothetical protein [unclassified Microcoleus]|uniref:hypothetical protein n=1 Tax=unclassified Microcoleus TaxID=2642155 RepID=UPI002FD44CD1